MAIDLLKNLKKLIIVIVDGKLFSIHLRYTQAAQNIDEKIIPTKYRSKGLATFKCTFTYLHSTK